MTVTETPSVHATTNPARPLELTILLALTLMLVRRAMTLFYIGDAGGSAEGDPPQPCG